jgi:hypothetical protein
MSELQLEKLPLDVARRTPGALLQMLMVLLETEAPKTIPIEQFCTNSKSKRLAMKLAENFEAKGSDKSSKHEYHWLYGSILAYFGSSPSILEVGLGSNNPDIASNMGIAGKPGASLRAFLELFPDSIVHGADIDETIQVDGAPTFKLDQTNYSSFGILERKGLLEYDLIIDDGLHSPDANLFTMAFALRHLSSRGAFVIEDIPGNALEIWQSVKLLLDLRSFRSVIVSTKSSYMFALCRDSSPLLRHL